MTCGGTTRLSFLDRLRGTKDDESWRLFHLRYGDLLYRYARARGASVQEAEEVVQDVELYLFKAMKRFTYSRAKGRFRAYLRASVVHALARRASKAARQEATTDPETIDQLAAVPNPEDPVWDREWCLHRLRSAFQSIAVEFEPDTVRAFKLYALETRPVREVADLLGLEAASIYQAKSRVLRRLREKVAELDERDDAWI